MMMLDIRRRVMLLSFLRWRGRDPGTGRVSDNPDVIYRVFEAFWWKILLADSFPPPPLCL
jgi:hypothetical protein